jgi:hypothetical protein
MEGGRHDGVVVADRLGRLASVLHDAVEGVEVLGGQPVQLHLAQCRADDSLDLSPIGPQRRRGELEALTLLEPLVEELPEGGADAVGARRRQLVDQVPQRLVRRPGRAAEGPGELLALSADRVGAEIDPELPHAVLQLPLGAPDAREWYADPWDSSWDFPVGSKRATR